MRLLALLLLSGCVAVVRIVFGLIVFPIALLILTIWIARLLYFEANGSDEY